MLKLITARFMLLSTTNLPPPFRVPVTVAEPVVVMSLPSLNPALSTLKTSPVIAKIEAVTEPVEVIPVAVVEPAVSTLNHRP